VSELRRHVGDRDALADLHARVAVPEVVRVEVRDARGDAGVCYDGIQPPRGAASTSGPRVFLYAQTVAGITGRLGRIANVTRQDTAALSREVSLDLAAIKDAWPAFESGFDSLRGRRMMGLIDNRAGTYRLCTERLPRDIENPLGLDETTIPGGRYLRLRLIGDPPGVYGQIAAAFDELFEHADHDPTRPLIEFYRREGEVDCLVPVNAAIPGA
jgi:hypothetical protein